MEKITLANNDGEKRSLPLDKASQYDLFNVNEIGLSKGDKVRITRNGFDQENKRLINGQMLEVSSISKSGKIILTNKQSKSTYTLDKDFGHIDHAYCSTSHSAQGKTVDRVFVSQPAATFTATDAKQFYVSISRGKEAVTVYTDDRKALLEYASELGDRQSAIELVNNRPTHIDYVLQHERDKSAEPKQPEPGKADLSPTINYFDDYEPRF